MDFKDELNKLSEHINTYRDHLYSEEATKTSLVSPFFRLLGYDDSNPLEIKPELSCGKWFNKGKKVDYGIYHDGKLSIIVECKHSSETNLAAHFEQLDYYFHALEPKFAILTNGIIYQFYTDIDKANKMDEIPFLEIDLSNVEGYQVAILEMFHKSCYDAETIWNYAKQHKELDVITAGVEEVIKRELYTPSEDLVRYFISKVYCGEISRSLLEHSAEVLKRHFIDLAAKQPQVMGNYDSNDNNKTSKIEKGIKNTFVHDCSKYAINGKGKYSKRSMVEAVVNLYVEQHPKITIKELKSLFDFNKDSRQKVIKYREEVRDLSRVFESRLPTNEVFYIDNQWGKSIQGGRFESFISYVNTHIEGITITKIE